MGVKELSQPRTASSERSWGREVTKSCSSSQLGGVEKTSLNLITIESCVQIKRNVIIKLNQIFFKLLFSSAGTDSIPSCSVNRTTALGL